jgi:hypothetical protein
MAFSVLCGVSVISNLNDMILQMENADQTCLQFAAMPRCAKTCDGFAPPAFVVGDRDAPSARTATVSLVVAQHPARCAVGGVGFGSVRRSAGSPASRD